MLPVPSECSITLATQVRSEIMVELNLSNPLKKPATFSCLIDGAGLKGSANVTVAPGEIMVYSLTYFPLFSAPVHRGAITFSNPDIGEFWYQLDLEALESPPIELPEMACAIGGKACVSFFLIIIL